MFCKDIKSSWGFFKWFVFVLEESDANLCLGGVARMIGKIREIREKDLEHTLVLHAGDFYQGTIWWLFKMDKNINLTKI